MRNVAMIIVLARAHAASVDATCSMCRMHSRESSCEAHSYQRANVSRVSSTEQRNSTFSRPPVRAQSVSKTVMVVTGGERTILGKTKFDFTVSINYAVGFHQLETLDPLSNDHNSFWYRPQCATFKARWNTRGTLWSAREKASVALSAELERHTRCVSHCLKSDVSHRRSTIECKRDSFNSAPGGARETHWERVTYRPSSDECERDSWIFLDNFSISSDEIRL